MSSKKSKTTKQHQQLCMRVIDLESTISSHNTWNHFGYSPFELIVRVEPTISNLSPQPLSIQLVFEDGQQIENNKNTINFSTIPSSANLFINKFGECKFGIQIDTYSMFHDNKPFKLVFGLSATATRHIIPCVTHPFRLVKHRLEIISEPDSIFYKDQGGKTNCLKCKILLKNNKNETVQNRDIPLIAKLLYEDMSITQCTHEILEIQTQNIHLKNGQCLVSFRINEVSKNHNKRAFRILFNSKSNDALYYDISSCVTQKIMVKSKKPKNKNKIKNNNNKKQKRKRKRNVKKEDTSDSDVIENNNNTPPAQKKQRFNNNNMAPYIVNDFNQHLQSISSNRNNIHVPPTLNGYQPTIQPGILPRIAYDPPDFIGISKKNGPDFRAGNGTGVAVGGVLGRMFEWCKLANWVMNMLEWTHCGYEYDEVTHSIDTCRPLYRCSYCLRYKNNAGYGKHEEWCQLKLALNEYQTKVKSLNNEWKYQMENKDNGQMTSLEIDDQMAPRPPGNGPMNGVLIPPPVDIHSYVVRNSNNNNNNNNIKLPTQMNKIQSVSRNKSEHGFDAFDENKIFVGAFGDDGTFIDGQTFDNGQYQPIFNPQQMLLRNQSDDYLFYNNIKSNIFQIE